MKQKTFLVLFLILFAATMVSAADSEGNFIAFYGPGDISWNPQHGFTTTEAQIFTGLYEGLTSYHPLTMRPVGAAAESWEISEDGRVYTFHIRPDSRFNDGTDITAGIFRNSWLKLLDPETDADYASLLDIIEGAAEYRKGTGSAEDVAVRVIGPKTLEVTLSNPAPHFLSILCHYSFVPLHPDLLNVDDWTYVGEIPVNGPFQLKSRSSREVVLVPNETYWDRETVEIPGIRILFSNDAQNAMGRFNRYEIDWIISGMDVSLLQIDQALVISPQFSTSYYYFNNRHNPVWENPQVRRALALLLPWQQIYAEQLIPGSTLVPDIPNYPRARGISRPNTEEALSLLEEAGYPEGHGLPTIVIRSPFPANSDHLANLMKTSWEKALDVHVRIESVPYPAYYGSLLDGAYTLGSITWVGDYADPLTFLQMWESGNSLNDAGFSDSVYDDLLKQAAVADLMERFRLLSEAETHLLSGGQVMPYEHFPAINLIDLRFVDGWYQNALDIHPFKYLKFKNDFVIPGLI